MKFNSLQILTTNCLPSALLVEMSVAELRPMLFDLSECGRPGLLQAASERGKTKPGKRGGPGGGPAPRRHGWSSVPLNRSLFKLDQGGQGGANLTTGAGIYIGSGGAADLRSRGCRGMGEAAPTGWLGVGRPVGPPVPWPRAMHRALPAPGRVSSSPTSRGVPSAVVGALDAGGVPGSGPAGSGWGTLLVRASTSMIRLLGRVDRASHSSPAVLSSRPFTVSVDPRAKSKGRRRPCAAICSRRRRPRQSLLVAASAA